MVIFYWQQIGLPGFEPTFGHTGLAFRAVSVTTGVVGDLIMLTGGAVQHMPTQCRSATLFDGGHDFQLSQTDVGLLSLSPSSSVGAKDIRYLKCWTHHNPDLRGLQGLDRTYHLT